MTAGREWPTPPAARPLGTCPTCGDGWTERQEAEVEFWRAEAAKWKARVEAEAESLRLVMDEGVRAW